MAGAQGEAAGGICPGSNSSEPRKHRKQATAPGSGGARGHRHRRNPGVQTPHLELRVLQGVSPRTRTTKTRFAAFARLARRAGYFDGDFAPGLGASACGLRKVELTGASFLSAFGFLASRLPRCLLPLPMIVHPMVVLPAAMY